MGTTLAEGQARGPHRSRCVGWRSHPPPPPNQASLTVVGNRVANRPGKESHGPLATRAKDKDT